MSTLGLRSGSRLARSTRRGGFLLWYAVLAGTGWWMAHLVTEASLVQTGCAHGHRVTWIMHALTAATGLATAQAAWLCVRLVQSARGVGEDEGTRPGRTKFLGWFGLGTNLISLLLIVVEGAYIVWLGPCARP